MMLDSVIFAKNSQENLTIIYFIRMLIFNNNLFTRDHFYDKVPPPKEKVLEVVKSFENINLILDRCKFDVINLLK